MTGVILAGGASKRMGEDKAFLSLGETVIIERVMGVLSSLFGRVFIVTDDPKKYASFDVEAVADVYPGIGALGGIHTGLFYARDEAAFFCACDMPFILPDLVKYIISKRGRAAAAVPVVGGNYEPLFSVYGKKCIRHIEAAIEGGEKRIVSFFPAVRIQEITEEELRAVDPELVSLMNINTPEDLARARRMIEGEGV
jgi:molybdopterin-guanine dinucleotide biosynthesis protein A